MNNQNHLQVIAPPPPQSPIICHTTISQILKQSTLLFYFHLLTFALLSSLLTFCSNVDSASNYLSSLIEKDATKWGSKGFQGLYMTWAVSGALAHLLGIYFFGEIDDQFVVFKIFLRMKLSAAFMVIWFLSLSDLRWA